MTVLVVQHRVRDFGAWTPVFDEHESSRRAHGARRHWLYRTAEDPNDVVVAIEFPRSTRPARSRRIPRRAERWSAEVLKANRACTCEMKQTRRRERRRKRLARRCAPGGADDHAGCAGSRRRFTCV
jgi:hypothetical protein